MTSAGWDPSDPAINKPTVIELGVEGEEQSQAIQRKVLRLLLLSWGAKGYYSSSVFRMKTIHCKCVTAEPGISLLGLR